MFGSGLQSCWEIDFLRVIARQIRQLIGWYLLTRICSPETVIRFKICRFKMAAILEKCVLKTNNLQLKLANKTKILTVFYLLYGFEQSSIDLLCFILWYFEYCMELGQIYSWKKVAIDWPFCYFNFKTAVSLKEELFLLARLWDQCGWHSHRQGMTLVVSSCSRLETNTLNCWGHSEDQREGSQSLSFSCSQRHDKSGTETIGLLTGTTVYCFSSSAALYKQTNKQTIKQTNI